MKGTFLDLRMVKDSKVWFSKPCIASTTRMAMSATLPPLLLRLAKASCPGVSTTRSPGTLTSRLTFCISCRVIATRVSRGK